MQFAIRAVALGLVCAIGLSAAQDAREVRDGPPPSSPPRSGHLQPLGSATRKLPIAELDAFLPPTEFFRSYVYPSVPVVFRGGARRSPAFSKWTDEHLRGLPGARETIAVESRKVEDRRAGTLSMTFGEFLDRYQTHDEYLVTDVPHFLKKDVLVPPPLLCENVTASFLDTVMWFSSGGTKSVLHNDDVDNINCLFSGQKEILFINYTRYRQQIVFDHPEGSYSGVNVEQVDFDKYPELEGVEMWQANLEAGDCIYIPYKWMHQVNSFDRNIAVNVWWNHKANILPSPGTCGRPDPALSLADVQFRRHEEDNSEEIPLELQFLNDPAQILMQFMEEERMASLTEDQLFGFLSLEMPTFIGGAWNEEALDLGHEIFQLLNVNDKQEITAEDLMMLPEEEDEIFFSHLEQKFMMLMDVIDEDIVKKRLKLMATSEENRTTAETAGAAGNPDPRGSTTFADQDISEKDEL